LFWDICQSVLFRHRAVSPYAPDECTTARTKDHPTHWSPRYEAAIEPRAVLRRPEALFGDVSRDRRDLYVP